MLLNKYKVQSYKFGEFRKQYTTEDMNYIEKIINHIKNNKVIYIKLVTFTAILIHFDINIYANDFSDSLDIVGNQIIDMLLGVAKWGCIGVGVKNMITTMLNGGSIKQATNEGIQYFIGFLFIQFYPQLFEMFKGIKF